MIHQCRQCVELDHINKLNISCSGVAKVGGGGGGARRGHCNTVSTETEID